MMKFRKYHLLLLLACIGLPLVGYTQATSEKACLDQLTLVMVEYGRLTASSTLFIHYRQWQEVSGQAGEKAENKIWIKGVRMRYENEFLRFFQDASTQVIVDLSSKSIVLQEVPKGAGNEGDDASGFFALPIQRQADSIFAVAKEVSCEGIGRIRVEFPERINGQRQNLKRLVCDYDPANRRLIRQVYTQYSPDGVSGEVSDVYLYDQLSNKVADADIPENVMLLVYSGKELLPEYQGYEVMDMRIKK
jgi:hypothetical protein